MTRPPFDPDPLNVEPDPRLPQHSPTPPRKGCSVLGWLALLLVVAWRVRG